MSEVLTGIVLNGIQHIITIIVGMAAVYLGYRLFIEMPRRREGETKLDLPGGVSIMLSRIGPGIFFALFGAGMIVYSITKPIEITDIAEQVASADGATRSLRSRTLTGLGDTGAGGAADAATARPALPEASVERGRVIEALNGIATRAQQAVSGSTLLDVSVAVRESKLALMREVWQADWGDYGAFHRWTTEQFEQDPPPPGNEKAAAFYRLGL
ncbi:MAG: hypothetical protein H6891_00325 [Brucellaceae bacterium]|nr:hypothetical protein [Brucellaceae bacterium]